MRILILSLFCRIAIAQSDFNYNRDFKKILSRTQDPKDVMAYDKLLKRFVANDSSLTPYEVLALMIGYTANPEFKPYTDISTEREIYRLNDVPDFDAALAKGRAFVVTHPVNQAALIEVAYTYSKKGNSDSATYYSDRYRKIMEAMEFSGKGTSPETAIFSLTPTDGQNYIRKWLRSKIGTMGSGSHEGNFLDILERVDKDTETGTMMYFNIQHATFELMNEIKGAEKKGK